MFMEDELIVVGNYPRPSGLRRDGQAMTVIRMVPKTPVPGVRRAVSTTATLRIVPCHEVKGRKVGRVPVVTWLHVRAQLEREIAHRKQRGAGNAPQA